MKPLRTTACCLALLTLASIASAQQPPNRPVSHAVFDAVLDSLYRSHGDQPEMIIVADSLYWREGGISYGGKFLLPHRSVIDQSTIESFEGATARSVPFPATYRYGRRFHVLSGAEYKEILARGDSIARSIPPRELREMPYWLAFTRKYPKAWGVTVLSRVGFNADSSEALISVRHQCGGGCYSSEVILLDRKQSHWRIVERMNAGSNEGLGTGSLRYLGPGAHFIADRRRLEDSTRRAVADSTRRDKLPRRIRGTVYNRLTGAPLPAAQIFVRSHSQYLGEATRRVVADSRGRYEVLNPPIGTTMLEVQCPGPGYRRGATLDAPSFYMFPALDTIIEMGPPDIEPCWEHRRAHRISSGELEVRSRAPMSHPSGSEKEIYAAMIRELHVDSTTFLVESETGPWCDWRYDCPTLSIGHLIRNGEVDSSTLRNFRSVAQDTVPLSPVAMGEIGARLFSSGERAYVRGEAARIAQFSADTTGRITPWSVLFDLYGASALVSFTRAGFNKAGDEAIVAVRVKAAQDREAETVLMKRTDHTWRVARRHLDAEHPSGDFVDGRCVAIASTAKPAATQMSSIAGDYDFSLVSSSVDDRLIPWRMRFLRDSANRAVFEVLDPQSGERKKSAEPGTYISGGNIHFMNAAGLIQIDGDGFALTIDRIEGDQVFGHWEHYSFGIPIGRDGKVVPEPAGHFCAVRREPGARSGHSTSRMP